MSIHFATKTITVTTDTLPDIQTLLYEWLLENCPYLKRSGDFLVHSNGKAGLFLKGWSSKFFGGYAAAVVDETVSESGFVRPDGEYYGVGGADLNHEYVLRLTYDDEAYLSFTISGRYAGTVGGAPFEAPATVGIAFATLVDLRTGEEMTALCYPDTQNTVFYTNAVSPKWVYVPATGQFYPLHRYPDQGMAAALAKNIAAGSVKGVCAAVPTVFYTDTTGVSNLLVWKNEKHKTVVFHGGGGRNCDYGNILKLGGAEATVLNRTEDNSLYTHECLFA